MRLEPSKEELATIRAERREMAHRARRIIFNNDGCDAFYFPGAQKVTPENLLAIRTAPFLGSQVDTLAYCTISSGFGFFTHNTKAGNILDREPAQWLTNEPYAKDKINATRPLIAQGTDTLKVMVDFCHTNNIEIFWSMRMNDTHDYSHTPEAPFILFSPIKQQHPEYLMGTYQNRPKHGYWSAVDYTHPEIRERAFRFIEEVCQNYDVDGVELDFFRHLHYFKTVSLGGKATAEELEMMTDLMRRIRRMTEKEGVRRGRPILVSVRVPDSVGYCREMGFDIERWLSEGLVDLLVGSGYFQLNPWEYLVALGHRYDVPVYPSLDESRVVGEAKTFRRQSQESYRARAMRAWQAGVDGIYSFNEYGAGSPYLREIGDPKTLRGKNKTYFATVRNGKPGSWLAGGEQFRQIPVLTPADPQVLAPNTPVKIEMLIGDDVASAEKEGLKPEVRCCLWVKGLDRAERLEVNFNGTPLSNGCLSNDWATFPVSLSGVCPGTNLVTIALRPGDRADVTKPGWDEIYEGKALPAAPWHLAVAEGSVGAVTNGQLRLADCGSAKGEMAYVTANWRVAPGDQTIVEARAKVISSKGPNGVAISVANGAYGALIGLYPDRVQIGETTNLSWAMDTTSAFHVYRVVMQNMDLKVYVDGQLHIEGKSQARPEKTNQMWFGSGSSTAQGESLWDFVRYTSDTKRLSDAVVSIRYGP
ncbi:MAG: hypothetical protein NT011_02490 [Kiritimatiellaeota bacterium]|nr:hypothetical protein [Kiritimatiellota bacterium]